MVFYVIVLEIAIFVAYYMGYYSGLTQLTFCGRSACPVGPYSAPPLRFESIVIGVVLGFLVMSILQYRRYISETLRIAFRKERTVEPEKEPMSYRSAWIMFIVSFVAMIIFLMYAGISPWLSFLIVVTGIMTWFVAAQLWGRLGIYWEMCYDFAPGFIRLLAYPTLRTPDITSTDLALGNSILMQYTHPDTTGWGGSLFASLASYKMASLTGTNLRNVLKIMVVAMFLSMLVTQFTYLGLCGLLGATRFAHPHISFGGVKASWWYVMWGRPTDSPIIEVTPWIAAGFVIMVVLRLLSARFLWVPDPLAIIPTFTPGVSVHGQWACALVAWIVKSMILKIGGSKLYEEKAVPFVGGFMLGTTLEVLIAAALGMTLYPRF
jgi:hypothetical protein